MQKKTKKMSTFSDQNFSQNIPNFDTLERVWQSLFKVYNQTLRQMGDNDFSVEHTGVRVREMAGTLERVVIYDAVAFRKAWDFLASSDDEDNDFLFIYFFSSNYFPGKGAKYGLLWGNCFFLQPWPMQGDELRIRKVLTKKTSKILKKSSPRASDTGKSSYKHNASDLSDRGSITIPPAYMRRPNKSKYCSVTTQNPDAENISVFVSGKYTIPFARQALIRVFNTPRPQRDTLALIKRRNVTTNTLEGIYQDEIWNALIVARTVTHWFNTTKSALVQVGNPSD